MTAPSRTVLASTGRAPRRIHRWTRPHVVANHPWRSEGTAIVRAVCGGLLFGAPLLYTMEVWWAGSHATPQQLLLVIGGLVVPVFLLNLTGGFRTTRDLDPRDALVDTVESLAIGMISTAAVLLVLREIDLGLPLTVVLGKVVYESVPFCLGIGIARHFLHGGRDAEPDDDDDDGDGDRDGETHRGGTATDLLATVIGATFIALSIAPTDEIPMLTSGMSPAWLIVLVAASLLTTYGIVFVAGFGDEESRRAQVGLFQHPTTETVACYLVALAVAACLLVLFQRGDGPPADLLHRTVVLGFPAAIGGAAGRLVT